MTPQKEFKIASIVLLFLGVVDIPLIAIGWFGADSPAFEFNAFLIAIFAITCAITLAKLYMGIMGLKYCKGTGKGTLHIKLAKIGVILAVLAAVITVMDLISGTGSIETLISDACDIYVIYWYFNLAKKNLV